MLEVTFRHQVHPEDRVAIAGILSQPGTFREDQVRVGLEPFDETVNPRPDTDYHWILAEDPANHVLGFACFGPVPMTEGTFDLYWIALARPARGRGVATRLEAEVVDQVRLVGGRWLLAETSSSPPYGPARRFYERTGYELLSTIADYYREGEHRLIFGKRIDWAEPPPQGLEE